MTNYVELFGDPVFLRVVRNTIVYTFCAVVIKFVLGLGMALVLSQDRPFNYIWRTILFVPWAVPTIVAALSFRWIYDDFSGLLNNFLIAVLQMEDVVSWLGDPQVAMASVVAVVVWSGTPFYTMSFLAGLKAIPKEMYEAARIDGANSLARVLVHHDPADAQGVHDRGHAVDDLDLDQPRDRPDPDQRRPGEPDPDPAQPRFQICARPPAASAWARRSTWCSSRCWRS